MKSTMMTVLCLALLVTATAAQEPFNGNTLVSVRGSDETTLIDLDGNVLQTWHGASGPAEIAYLLPDGSLLRPTRDADLHFGSGGRGGRIQRIDANDNVVWDFIFSSETFIQHHDVEPMPNGNVLIVAWDRKTEAEAKALGRLDVPRGELWPTLIVEVEPEGLTGGNIVWEWPPVGPFDSGC